MRLRSGALAALALLAALAVAWIARAQASRRVIVTGASEQDPTIVRIRRELSALGFRALYLPSPPAGTASADLARTVGAAAVLRVEADPPAVVLWVDPAARPAGAERSAELRVEAKTPGPTEGGTLALAAVELLHGALLPVPVRAATPDATAAASESAPAIAPTTASRPPDKAAPRATQAAPEQPVAARPRNADLARPTFLLGGGAMASPGGLGPAAVAEIGCTWAPLHPLSLALWGIVPTTAATIAVPEGRLATRSGAAGFAASFSFFRPAAAVDAEVGLGIGALFFAVSGTARPPNLSESGLTVAVFPHARAGFGFRFAPWLGLRADMLAGVARPEPVARSVSRSVASFGEPAVAGLLALEARP